MFTPGVDVKVNYENHPFKQALYQMLSSHFAPSVLNNFEFILEVELYTKANPNILRQMRDDKFICEVHYKENGLLQYICDVGSFWPKEAVEAHMLRYITDKFKQGVIGKDWSEGRTGKVDKSVLSGKRATIQ